MSSPPPRRVFVPSPLSVTDPFNVGLPTSALIQLIWALALVAQRANTPSERDAPATRHLCSRFLRFPDAERFSKHRSSPKDVVFFMGSFGLMCVLDPFSPVCFNGVCSII